MAVRSGGACFATKPYLKVLAFFHSLFGEANRLHRVSASNDRIEGAVEAPRCLLCRPPRGVRTGLISAFRSCSFLWKKRVGEGELLQPWFHLLRRDRRRLGVNRLQELDELGSIAVLVKSVDAVCAGAAVWNVLEYCFQRISRAAVKEGRLERMN